MDINTQRFTKTSFWQKIALIIFGLFLSLILIETGLSLGGLAISSLQELRNKSALMHKGNFRILCLGESTTSNQYPAFLEEALNQSKLGIKFSVIDKGVAATRSWVIVSKLESYIDTYHPDMVITMMGINDFGMHIPYETISDSKIINFLKSFRIYKLSRLFWLHIVNKFEEFKLNKELESNFGSDWRCVEFGRLCQKQGKLSASEKSFKKAIEANPKCDWAYIELGKLYLQQGSLSEADESFNKAMKLNPSNEWIYIELGKFYVQEGKLSASEKSFKKAIELNPRNEWAYIELGQLYRWRGKDKLLKAEELFKKVLEFNPKCDWAYIELGKLYTKERKFPEAEKLFKRAIELNLKVRDANIELGRIYQNQGRFLEAEGSFREVLKVDPANDCAYGALEVLFTERGNIEVARKYGKEARDLRLGYYPLYTVNNYRNLKSILDKRRIIYVCVQYPVRNLGPLKKIFQGNDKGIIFVDNESVFKNAILKDGYKTYFRDMFGGDFGHCTKEGNKLLADNIAKVILKEAFGK